MAQGIRLSVEDFISRCTTLHKGKYKYNKVKEIPTQASGMKLAIKCLIQDHDYFFMTPDNHLRGHGCPRCGHVAANAGRVEKAKRTFIQKAKEIHGRKFSYKYTKYVLSSKKVQIRCNSCKQDFWQTPNNHLRGQGCPHCRLNEKAALNRVAHFNNVNASYKRGTFRSKKTGKRIHYRSSYEREALRRLEKASNVLDYEAESLAIPYRLHGKEYHYIPDFLVTTASGRKHLVEVKPKKFVDSDMNRAKFKAAKNFARSRDWTFRVWTEERLFS